MNTGASRFLAVAMALLLSSGVVLADTAKEKAMMTDKQPMGKQDGKMMKEEKGGKEVDKKMMKEESMKEKPMKGENSMEKGKQIEMK